MSPARLAGNFHEMAEPFLSSLGIVLISDLTAVGRLGETSAQYKSRNGFFLFMGFVPFDGPSTGISCGRRWTYTPASPMLTNYSRLSNSYHVLAKRFGFELPAYYPLGPDIWRAALKRMLDDLESTLPTILERLTLADLVAVEREEMGCQWAQERYGHQPPAIRLTTVSDFPE